VNPEPVTGRSYDAKPLPFQLKGSVQTILSLKLLAPEDPDFFKLLLDRIAFNQNFYRNAPVLIDAGPVAERPPLDMAAFVDGLRQHRLVPIGIQNGSAAWNEAAVRAGLSVFQGGTSTAAPEPGPIERSPAQRPAAPPPVVVAPPPPPPPPPPPAPAASVTAHASLVISEPIRGGQLIEAPEGDLVVLSPVGHGAELVAAGHIHVYNIMRGRAFAGVNGDESAMIFCDQLAAELVSIAGVHMVSEQFDERLINRRVRIHCLGEKLWIGPLP
jgi:septum site-determining protein MinC